MTACAFPTIFTTPLPTHRLRNTAVHNLILLITINYDKYFYITIIVRLLFYLFVEKLEHKTFNYNLWLYSIYVRYSS